MIFFSYDFWHGFRSLVFTLKLEIKLEIKYSITTQSLSFRFLTITHGRTEFEKKKIVILCTFFAAENSNFRSSHKIVTTRDIFKICSHTKLYWNRYTRLWYRAEVFLKTFLRLRNLKKNTSLKKTDHRFSDPSHNFLYTTYMGNVFLNASLFKI